MNCERCGGTGSVPCVVGVPRYGTIRCGDCDGCGRFCAGCKEPFTNPPDGDLCCGCAAQASADAETDSRVDEAKEARP
jgi:hypothetical protein